MSARFMGVGQATGWLLLLLVVGPAARADETASPRNQEAPAVKPGIAAALAYRLKAERAAVDSDPFGEPDGDAEHVSQSSAERIRERAESRARFRAQRSAEDRIRATLGDATSLGFIETPLREVMEYLSDFHQIPIFIVETALGDEGIASDTPVSITIDNVTLRSALHLLLRELNLQYEYADEVLMITTKASALDVAEVRIHPVGDLLTCTSDGKLDAAGLAGVIMAAVCPDDEWTEMPTGGWKAGLHGQLSIVPFGDTLVVRHSWSTQEEIEAVLARLREATAKRK